MSRRPLALPNGAPTPAGRPSSSTPADEAKIAEAKIAEAKIAEAKIAEATRVAATLDAIGRLIRQSVWAEARRMPVPLTPPQQLALRVLVKRMQTQPEAGISLTELSRRMGLAHSTVSGIVDRLERQGLVARIPRSDDRRSVGIELTPAVRDWVEHELPARKLDPLASALLRATDAEWSDIVNGVEALERLLIETRREDEA
jgi:DNA-binding MarR family transcriptional regulator